MTTKLSDEVRQDLADILNKIIVTGFRIEMVSMSKGSAKLQLSLIDQNERPCLTVGEAVLSPGDVFIMTGIERALNITIY